MAGETDLSKLLADMSPKLTPGVFVFCTVDKSLSEVLQTCQPLGTYHEKEGLTLILDQKEADNNGLKYEGIYRCITLEVHSSLEAVGLTSAISKKLTENGISANVVAAFYHDHVFVPESKAELALNCLLELTR